MHALTITNAVANLLALLLNQEGWVKGVDELIVTGDLLQSLPDERPSEDVEEWEKKPFSVTLSGKQFKAAKHCFTSVVEKGNLLPTETVLRLAEALEYEIPTTEPTIKIKLPNISAKYLSDVFAIQGRLKDPADLIAVCQVINKLPKLDTAMATDKSREKELKEWMVVPVEFTITERQRDVCRKVLKATAEDGSVRSNKYIPALYTEFGLRE